MKLSYLAAAVLALALAAPAAAQQPIVIKFSHVVAVDTPKGKGAERFKQLAEERTKGRVKVEVYPNSSLFKDGEEMEALQLGSVQMLAPSVAKFGPLGAREFEVFDLPYIFDSFDELHKVTDGPVGKQLFQKLDSKGIIGLAYWDNGFKEMSANKPMQGPGRLQGPQDAHPVVEGARRQMKALGAIPQVMAFSRSTRRCRPAWSTAPRTRRRTSTRRRCTRCRSTCDDRPRRHRVRGDRQQEVLGRPAARHPHDAREAR
jgi:C4-dicarboxylate-binding protein DctP